MKSLPIIIVHKGDSFYLEPVLKQIRLYNPTSRICLISTEDTKHYSFLEHYNIADYSGASDDFAKKYVHLSINPYDYELFCFQRWFIIWEFIQKEKLDYFVCLDSDVLIYCNIDEVFNSFLSYDFTICKIMGPCFTLFNSNSIDKFCSYILSLYSTDTGLSRLRKFKESVKEGGVCDMTAFTWYQTDVSNNVYDLVVPFGNACFDGNISDSMGFEMSKGVKKIYWINHLPYGRYKGQEPLIRFYGLHLQGGVKHKMYKYLVNSNKEHKISMQSVLQWMFLPKRLQTRFRELKKMLDSPVFFWMIIKKKLSISRLKQS